MGCGGSRDGKCPNGNDQVAQTSHPDSATGWSPNVVGDTLETGPAFGSEAEYTGWRSRQSKELNLDDPNVKKQFCGGPIPYRGKNRYGAKVKAELIALSKAKATDQG